MFCCCSFLCIYFQATLPCHQHSTLASQTREDLYQHWVLPGLLSITFSFSSTTSATILSGHFYPLEFFTLHSFPTFWHIPDIFAEPVFIRVLLGAGSYFKVAELHTDPRNNHSNPQSSVHLNFVFMHINIAKVLLVVKTLIRSAATLFSSHENIKQQPN